MNVPGVFAVAFSCVALSAVPYVRSPGVVQVMTGVALRTLMETVFVAVVKLAPSVGVKVADNVWPAPAFSTVPAIGLQTNVPGVFAVAFSCVAPSAVPKVMSAGVAHVITGVAFTTLIVTVLVAVVKFAASVGVNVTDSVCAAPAFKTVPETGV